MSADVEAASFSVRNDGANVVLALVLADGKRIVWRRPVAPALVALGHLRDAVSCALDAAAREAAR